MKLVRAFALVLVWAGAGAAVVGFVQPWAYLDMREPSALKQVRGIAQQPEVVQGVTKGLGKGLSKLGKITATIRRGAETVTGELPNLSDIPRQVSGIQIPQLANQPNAKVATALIELLMNERQHIGAKSYLVYVLPGVALLAALLLTFLGSVLAVSLGAALLCAAVAGVGFWKLLTTNTTALFIAITIGPGLWMSLWGYVAIAAGGLLKALARDRKS